MPLYFSEGAGFLNRLRGMFAFVLYDAAQDHWLIARDPVGIIPLYTGFDDEGRLYVASEMKALMAVCTQVQEFPPGHYWAQGDDAPTRLFHPGLGTLRSSVPRTRRPAGAGRTPWITASAPT